MEQYLVSEMARCCDDHQTESTAMTLEDPTQMKKLPRKLQHHRQGVAKWNQEREQIATQGIMAKFQQNSALKMLLMATGDTTIGEASPSDSTWGIGLSLGDPAAKDPFQVFDLSSVEVSCAAAPQKPSAVVSTRFTVPVVLSLVIKFGFCVNFANIMSYITLSLLFDQSEFGGWVIPFASRFSFIPSYSSIILSIKSSRPASLA